ALGRHGLPLRGTESYIRTLAQISDSQAAQLLARQQDPSDRGETRQIPKSPVVATWRAGSRACGLSGRPGPPGPPPGPRGSPQRNPWYATVRSSARTGSLRARLCQKVRNPNFLAQTSSRARGARTNIALGYSAG